jgi:hypothetical protein
MAEHHDQKSKRARQDAVHHARMRAAYINVGRTFYGLVKLWLRRPGGWRQHRNDIVFCLISAANCYLSAGMTTKARAIGRWGERLRREMARQEGWE